MSKGEDRCRHCGGHPDHLHHIVPRSKSRLARCDARRNGMPLCFTCHRGWHDRAITIWRDRLSAEELHYATEVAGEWWLDMHYPQRPDGVDAAEWFAREIEEAGFAPSQYPVLSTKRRG
jgi:hypothetical protein